MKRREFIKAGALAGALSAAPAALYAAGADAENKPVSNTPTIIKPSRLKAGDAIGLVSPASYCTEDHYNQSAETVLAAGLVPVPGLYAVGQWGYFAATDKQRAEDINVMFADQSIKGIMCVRGGWGSARILDYLDYDLIRANPKPFIGFSDITALHYALFAKAGLISFHGPVGATTMNEFTFDYFMRTLVNPEDKLVMTIPERDKPSDQECVVPITEGKAQGRLAGGNLSIVVTMIGTAYDVDTTDKIVYLEDVDENVYRVDRMLTHMLMAGKFEKAAGIALGVFDNCNPERMKRGQTSTFELIEILVDRLGGLGIPVLYGYAFGHISDKYTLPFGGLAEMDTAQRTLTLLEPAVR